MKSRPTIGLTLDSEPPGGYASQPWYAIRENYCAAVLRGGGSDAIHELALLSSKKGLFNHLMSSLFRHRQIAKLLYPALVVCRNLLLKILGRSRINNLGLADNDRF